MCSSACTLSFIHSAFHYFAFTPSEVLSLSSPTPFHLRNTTSLTFISPHFISTTSAARSSPLPSIHTLAIGSYGSLYWFLLPTIRSSDIISSSSRSSDFATLTHRAALCWHTPASPLILSLTTLPDWHIIDRVIATHGIRILSFWWADGHAIIYYFHYSRNIITPRADNKRGRVLIGQFRFHFSVDAFSFLFIFISFMLIMKLFIASHYFSLSRFTYYSSQSIGRSPDAFRWWHFFFIYRWTFRDASHLPYEWCLYFALHGRTILCISLFISSFLG